MSHRPSGSYELPLEFDMLLARARNRGVDVPALSFAHLESVAALLEVTPTTVESLREALERPGVGAAAEATNGRFSGAVAEGPEMAVRAAPSPDAEKLLAEVRASPTGEEFLLHAPLETVAVLFGVHPFLAEEARELLRAARRDEGSGAASD